MDRTLRGLLAGAIAGIAMNFWNLLDYYFFHIIQIRFLDWVNLYRVPVLSSSQPVPGALSNLLAVILFGIVLGLVLKKLDKPPEV